MLSLFWVILIIVVLFKMTGVMFRVTGHLIGAVLSIFGWLFLAGMAVTVFGLMLYAVPVILGLGVMALIAES